jgi:hypothetical protein
MKSFKDFGIKTKLETFIGEKIRLTKIINKQISVLKYRLEPSKHNSGLCLSMQIEVDGSKHVVFTGASVLIDNIKQVPEFPFTTTIIKDNDHYEFT